MIFMVFFSETFCFLNNLSIFTRIIFIRHAVLLSIAISLTNPIEIFGRYLLLII